MTVDKCKKMGETTTIHEWHQGLPDTNQCHRHIPYDMAKSIQISRVTSANTTHSTKISAVNHRYCKQLSNDVIHQGREFIAIGALGNGAFCTVFSENFHKF
jgi:hypothetical protein